MLNVLIGMFFPEMRILITILRYTVLVVMLFFQFKYYKFEIGNKYFIFFIVIYSIYILLYITTLQKLPLDVLIHVPQGVGGFCRLSVLFFGYLLCCKIIYNYFNVRKYILLSLICCTLPSLLYINFVGIDFLQTYGSEVRDDELFVHQLTISFTNVPILVLSVLNYKKLFFNALLSKVMLILIILSVGFILIVSTKRGPILWSIVNIFICYMILKKYHLKYMLSVFVSVFVIALNYEYIFRIIEPFAPKTVERMEKTITEGDTSGRINSASGQSAWPLAIKQFSSSPVYGSYFRLYNVRGYFRGHYPHNLFLEILITMGIIGIIPFVMLTWIAFRNMIFAIKDVGSENAIAFAALFLACFLERQSTGSIVFDTSFWLFFMMMLDFEIINKPNQIKAKLVHIIRKLKAEKYGLRDDSLIPDQKQK